MSKKGYSLFICHANSVAQTFFFGFHFVALCENKNTRKKEREGEKKVEQERERETKQMTAAGAVKVEGSNKRKVRSLSCPFLKIWKPSKSISFSSEIRSVK